MSMVEDVEIIIYGVNGYSKAFCAFYGPSQISAFVDDDPCEDSHFTVQPAKSVLEKPMGTETLVLLAKRRPKMNDGRFINIVPLCLVLVAREQYLYLSRYRLDQLLLDFKQMDGLLKNQISPRTSLEFILVGLGCVGGSLKQWRVWIKALFKSPFLRETYEVLYDVLGYCGLTKSRYLLFRLLARYNGLNDTGYELYIESIGSVMDIYSHSHDQMHACKWARRVYTLSLAFLNRSQQPYRFLKRTAVAAQELFNFEVPIKLLNEANNRRSQFGNSKFLFLSPSLMTRVGSTMHVETLVRSQLLGWAPRLPLFSTSHGQGWGNSHLVETYLSKYIKFIENTKLPTKFLNRSSFNDAWYELGIVQNGLFRFTPAATIAARKAWSERMGEPFLALREEDKVYGMNILSEQGYDPTRPFVTIHCRGEQAENTAFRNTSIDTLLLTLSWLVKQGFTVVRIGDNSMPPLPPFPNIWDVACSSFSKNARLNVFLMASCAFFVGSASGAMTVASAFGVSTATFDTLPLGAACGLLQDTILPNLVKDTQTQQLVTWERAWSMEASTAHFKHQWQKMGLKPLPSSGQDILELVQYHAQKTGWVNIDTEMLPQPAPEVARQFSKLLQFPYSEISHPIQCELSPAFMTRYAHLLPGGGI